jgi:hypothetical protein
MTKLFLYTTLSLFSLSLYGLEHNKTLHDSHIGVRYLQFITAFASSHCDFTNEAKMLFAPEVAKIINAMVICNNRDELLAQMSDVKEEYNVHAVTLHESFVDDNHRSITLRWEIVYKDSSAEAVITILKYHEDGLIYEINEVFAQKEGYNWPEIARKDLVEIAQEYLQFVHDVGSAKSVQADDVRLKALFAENLTKIDNRAILFQNNRDSLLSQMKGFEKEYNPESRKADWVLEIDTAIVIPSLETNTVVAHFEWTHVNVGKGTTTAILQCNADGQIERITDVWAKVPK